jgi:phytoene dehydrogenase-like protein
MAQLHILVSTGQSRPPLDGMSGRRNAVQPCLSIHCVLLSQTHTPHTHEDRLRPEALCLYHTHLSPCSPVPTTPPPFPTHPQTAYFLKHSATQRKTLAPKGYEAAAAAPATAAAAASKPSDKKAAKAAAAAAAKKEVPGGVPLPPKPKGKVIVVGAGPAGLAAATVLQVRTGCVYMNECMNA